MPSYVPQAVQRVRIAAASRLLAAAVTLQSQTKLDHNTSYPPASKPGEYPRTRTQNLREGIVYAPITKADVAQTLTVKVGLTQQAFYGLILWTKARRLGMADTMKRIRGQLQAIIRGAKT